MNSARCCLLACAIALAAAGDGRPPAAPLTPDAALAAYRFPPGLAANVVASEPELVKPVDLTFDDRGRLWVVEYRTFAQKYDLGQTDRILVFDPPAEPAGRWGRPRVFWEGKRVTSVEVGFGGAWVLAAPQLLFIPDRDGDAVADGAPEPVLDGWPTDIRWTNNIVNNLGWGPDGWLYGSNGAFSDARVGAPGTPDGQRVRLRSGIWRMHPVRRTVEVVAEGGTNGFGIDFDAHGELIMPNVDGDHLFHVLPGGHYWRVHGAAPDPFAYVAIPGFNAPRTRQILSGLVIYQGDDWPAEWQGRLLSCVVPSGSSGFPVGSIITAAIRLAA